MKIMPGGGTAAKLAKDYIPSTVPLKNGKINNVLLSQVITLDMNIHIQGDVLAGFVLKAGYLTTQQGDASTCPITQVLLCSKSSSAVNSLKLTTNATLMNLLNGKTVTDLFNMASAALGGTLPSGVTYADINNAVDVINRSFDGGRFFLGYYTTQQSCSTLSYSIASARANTNTIGELTVKAYPNPYQDKVNFIFTSPVSGTALLEVYDMLGNKLAIVYQGKVDAGVEHTILYNVPAGDRVTLIYKLSVGDKTSHAMLLPGK
jgi:hypothetical protein